MTRWASAFLLLLRGLDDQQIMLLGDVERDIRADERERIANAVRAERMVDDTGDAGDIAYNHALADVLALLGQKAQQRQPARDAQGGTSDGAS